VPTEDISRQKVPCRMINVAAWAQAVAGSHIHIVLDNSSGDDCGRSRSYKIVTPERSAFAPLSKAYVILSMVDPSKMACFTSE
jgi:hypothetical protein